jgi:hypothetical protein
MSLPDTWPAGGAYDEVPDMLREIIRRSYRERDSRNQNLVDGFIGAATDPNPQDTQPFKDVLDRLIAHKDWKVLLEIYNRCKHKVPKLWEDVRWLNAFYDHTSSRGVWVCYQPDKLIAAHRLLKASDTFCGDLPPGHSTHQKTDSGPLPSQCYRELGVVGEVGLHICLTVPAKKKSEFGEWQNFHIDPHQIGAEKTSKCACWYAKVNKHMTDVGLWCCREFLKNHGSDLKVRAAMAALSISTAEELHRLVLAVCGDYDTFVDMADNPAKYSVGADLNKRTLITYAGLYKNMYMDQATPEFDV